MNHTALHRAAPRARSPELPSNYIAKELRRYDAYLRDVRGLAAGTRRWLATAAEICTTPSRYWHATAHRRAPLPCPAVGCAPLDLQRIPIGVVAT